MFGNRGDTGAKIFAINIDIHEPVDNLIDFNAEQGTNGIYITEADGTGNYEINKLPIGDYYVFIVSKNTSSSSNNLPVYASSSFSSEISQKEWLSIQTAIKNVAFLRSVKVFENIIINENEEKILSHDFGLTAY